MKDFGFNNEKESYADVAKTYGKNKLPVWISCAMSHVDRDIHGSSRLFYFLFVL